ncbi:MAG TPA: efflux RND transporter periplasmic adaptor subunit, partial [Gallionellaceae bacterium]|nr:efflux RND transporter periplasmic adaptor subunit [Gallionellaceae bacterium]
ERSCLMNNKLNTKILWLVAVLALSGGTYFGWTKYSRAPVAEITAEKTSARTATDILHFDANAPQLTFLKIQPVEAFPEPLVESLNARIAYDDNHTARVFSPIAGRVVNITAELGHRIKAGDALLSIDSPDFAQAASDRVKADADLVRKKIAFERAKQLFDINGLARKDLESAEGDFLQAEAEAQRAKARMKNLNSNAINTSGQFVLRAPIPGIISERQVNAGSEVRPDATVSLFVITDPRQLWVMVDLPERQLGQVYIGQPVSVEVDAYPGETFSGKVAVIGETLDPVTRRVQVRCDVDNKSGRLKPEMFASVTPVANAKSSIPRIPNSALFTQGLYSFVFVETAPGVLQRRKIMLSMQGRDFSYVKEGLKTGERVVTSGSLLLNSELGNND